MFKQFIRESEQEDDGVTYHNFKSILTAAGVVCIGNKRIILTGNPKITVMKNSKRFGDELQFTLLAKKGQVKVEDRNGSAWNTIEINIPLEVGKALIEVTSEALK